MLRCRSTTTSEPRRPRLSRLQGLPDPGPVCPRAAAGASAAVVDRAGRRPEEPPRFPRRTSRPAQTLGPPGCPNVAWRTMLTCPSDLPARCAGWPGARRLPSPPDAGRLCWGRCHVSRTMRAHASQLVRDRRIIIDTRASSLRHVRCPAVARYRDGTGHYHGRQRSWHGRRTAGLAAPLSIFPPIEAARPPCCAVAPGPSRRESRIGCPDKPLKSGETDALRDRLTSAPNPSHSA